jgi:hypothetical protein
MSPTVRAPVWPSRPRADGLRGDATPFGGGFSQEQCGARRRIDLHAVVHLDDLDIPPLIQAARDLAHEAGEKVHAERHVAGLDDPRPVGCGSQSCEVVLRQAGGADHVNNAGVGGARREARVAAGLVKSRTPSAFSKSARASAVTATPFGPRPARIPAS